MPQLRLGTATVANLSNRVIGNVDTDWSTVVPGASLFGLLAIPANYPTPAIYTVATKVTPAVSLSHFWELTLTANFGGLIGSAPIIAGTTPVTGEYIIHKDFTPSMGLAIFAPGDQFGFQIHNRNSIIVDSLTGFGAGEVPDGYYFRNPDDGNRYYLLQVRGAPPNAHLTLSDSGVESIP